MLYGGIQQWKHKQQIERIGQERNVMVYRLLSTGTFEERIEGVLNKLCQTSIFYINLLFFSRLTQFI
jgi:hypothetical protein